MELEHLISCEALRSTILSGATGADIPSVCTFLKILSGDGLEYNSNDIDYYAPPLMRYHIDDEVLAKDAPGLMLPK